MSTSEGRPGERGSVAGGGDPGEGPPSPPQGEPKSADRDETQPTDLEPDIVIVPTDLASSEPSWLDRTAILDDPGEDQLLEQFHDGSDDVGRSLAYAHAADNPDVTKRHVKAVLDSLRTMRATIKTLDRLRHGDVQRIVITPRSMLEVGGGVRRSPEKAKLAKSDELLNAYLAQAIRQLRMTATSFRQSAEGLRRRPYPPPARNPRGRAYSRDRGDWDDKFAALANRLIRESIALQNLILARKNRGVQQFIVDDRRKTKTKAPSPKKKASAARRRKGPSDRAGSH